MSTDQQRAKALLVRAVAGLLIALLCIGLYQSLLRVGFLADDLFQIAMLEGRLETTGPLDLYAFARTDPEATASKIERGVVPWWTHENFRFAMLRPLSSLLVAFDHGVFGPRPWFHHLHSLLWFFAALWAGYYLLARLFSPLWGLLGVALFAIDETMVWMIGWLANRCALVSAVFGLLALALHHRGRCEGWRSWPWELGAWLLAFAGGEYAIGGVAYVLAYELSVPTDGWKKRAQSLWPACVAMALYATVYWLGGYGVYGGNTYIDPLRETGAFLEALPHRFPRMMGEVWLNFAAEGERVLYRYEDSVWMPWILPEDGSSLVVRSWRHARFSLVGTALVVGLSLWLMRRWLAESERRYLRFMLLGSAIALLPLAAVAPATRTLIFANFGAAVWACAVLIAAGRCATSRIRSKARCVALILVAAGVLWLHAISEAVHVREQARALVDVEKAYRALYRHPQFVQLDLADKHVVVVAMPGLVTGIHGRSMLELFGREPPASWQVLAMDHRPYLVRRLGPYSIELDAVGGPMHSSPQASLFRASEDAMRTGDAVDAGLFRATVLRDQEAQGPIAVRFDFDVPLDDPRLVLLGVGPGGLAPLRVPSRGTTAVPPPELPEVVPTGPGSMTKIDDQDR